MEVTKIRNILPETVQNLFDDIVKQRVLGASKHINMIGNMIKAIASQYAMQNLKTQNMIKDIHLLVEYFEKTRGESSKAVANAINLMVKDLDSLEDINVKKAAKKINDFIDGYDTKAKKDIMSVVEYSVNLAKYMKNIMVFDYSSTVNMFLSKLGNENQDMTIYIPESRIINGGYAFVITSLNAGFKIRFIPDAAIMFSLKDCDAAFFGAETFYPDGTVLNTTGSDIVGLVCKEYNIPLYVLTPMIKIDNRPINGFKYDYVINDLKDKMADIGFKDDEKEKVEFSCPEIVPVEAKYIKAFVTELGVIPANQMYTISLDYYKTIKRR